MKNKIIKIISILFLFILLLFVENITDGSDLEVNTEISIIVFKENVARNTVIDESILKEIKISKSSLTENLITEKNSVVGKYADIKIEKNQYIYKNQFSDYIDYNLSDNDRLITIELDIVTSNGWHLSKNQVIDLILVMDDDNIVIEDIVIERVFNEKLEEITNPFSRVPDYISVIVTPNQYMLYISNIKNSKPYISIK